MLQRQPSSSHPRKLARKLEQSLRSRRRSATSTRRRRKIPADQLLSRRYDTHTLTDITQTHRHCSDTHRHIAQIHRQTHRHFSDTHTHCSDRPQESLFFQLCWFTQPWPHNMSIWSCIRLSFTQTSCVGVSSQVCHASCLASSMRRWCYCCPHLG